MQTAIPCTLMRSGTSRGLFFVAEDLPTDATLCDQVLLELYGNHEDAHISGVDGNNSVMNKVAIVSASPSPDADVDYRFGQINPALGFVDTGPTCGNMLAGVGPFALERGLLSTNPNTTTVRIRDLNTGALANVEVQTPDAKVQYDGDMHLGGLVEAAAPIKVTFFNLVGNKTGYMLPTGNAQDLIDGIPVTLIDIAMPMVLFRAADLGLKGDESPHQLNHQTELIERMEDIRLQASIMMGLGDASDSVIPKMAILSPPSDQGNIRSRYFVPDKCHPAHAVSGAFCVTAATLVPGTIGHDVCRSNEYTADKLVLEHPSGKIDVEIDARIHGHEVVIHSTSLFRTAKRIMSGMAYVSERIWQRVP